MRYLITLDRERGEGVLCTETGIVLRYKKEKSKTALLQSLTEQIPYNKKQAAIHIAYGDGADSAACDRLEEEIKATMGERTAVVCEDRMVHRIYAVTDWDEADIIVYTSPDAGAGRLYGGGLLVRGGVGAPVYSDGSAYEMAIKTIRAALSASEKAGPPTVLSAFLEEAFGLPCAEIKHELSKMDYAKISAYARLTAKGRRVGDAVSVKLWNETVTALSRYIRALSHGEEMHRVILSETPQVLELPLIQDLSACLGEKFTVTASSHPILLGGIKRCAEMLGISADEGFCRTFLETYKNFR